MSNPVEQISNFKSVFNHFIGYEGAGKPHTPTSLSLITGIPITTIRSHMDGKGSHPNYNMLMLYMKVLDISFTDALLSPAGISVCRAEEHEAPTSHKALSGMAKTMHKLAVALEDNNVDDIEKKTLSPELRANGQAQIALANTFDDEVKG